MTDIFTIGFAQKSASQFFELLAKNKVKYLIDIRLNNASQLAGFAKGKDLAYFCQTILGIHYKHDLRFAPTKELLDGYRKKRISWKQYVEHYNQLLEKRKIKDVIIEEYKEIIDGCCFLCSEPTPDKCHRRLLTNYIQKIIPNCKVHHL